VGDRNELPRHDRADYNLGNAQAQLELWQQSISAFRRALELVPSYEDARLNLDRVVRRMPVSRR
jgi:tetratricopeptide (TPR) repeat protein